MDIETAMKLQKITPREQSDSNFRETNPSE